MRRLVVFALLLGLALSPAAAAEDAAIPLEVLESPEYQEQLKAFAVELEAAAAERPVSRAAGGLKRGTGFVSDVDFSSWRYQGTRTCTREISLPCNDPRAPAGCREPNCRALLELSAEIQEGPLGWIPVSALEKLVGPVPKAKGAQPVGAGQERGYWLNPLTLRACCLKGRWGDGWDCQATNKESLLLAYTVPDGTGPYRDCLPAPEDTDKDSVPNALDACDDTPGPAPSGCPVVEPGPSGVDRALELIDAARKEVEALQVGPNSTGKLLNRLKPKRVDSPKGGKPRPPAKIAEDLRQLAAELEAQDGPPAEELPAGAWRHEFPGFESDGNVCPSRVAASDDDARLCPRQVSAFQVVPPAGSYKAARLEMDYWRPPACPSYERADAKCEMFLLGPTRSLLGYLIGSRGRFGHVKGFGNKSVVDVGKVPVGEWLSVTVDAIAGEGGGSWAWMMRRQDGSVAASGLAPGRGACRSEAGGALDCFPASFDYDGKGPIVLHLGDSGAENPAEGAGGKWRNVRLTLFRGVP